MKRDSQWTRYIRRQIRYSLIKHEVTLDCTTNYVQQLRHFLEAIICCYLERAVFYCDLTFKNHLSLLLSFFICRDTFLRMRKTLNAGFYFTLPLTFINRFQQIRDISKFEIKTAQQSFLTSNQVSNHIFFYRNMNQNQHYSIYCDITILNGIL